MSAHTQSQTPSSSLQPLPDKQALLAEFKGKSVGQLRTPALLVDAATFERNCERVTSVAQGRGMLFRAHVKSESDLGVSGLELCFQPIQLTGHDEEGDNGLGRGPEGVQAPFLDGCRGRLLDTWSVTEQQRTRLSKVPDSKHRQVTGYEPSSRRPYPRYGTFCSRVSWRKD